VVKKYMLASVGRAYAHANKGRVGRGVMMHEVINSNLPCRFHLDIEMSAQPEEFFGVGVRFLRPYYTAAMERW
jgi:hypothetical protein